MKQVQGRTEQNEQVIVELDNVKFFGTEVEHKKNQQGQFKSFHIRTWVKKDSKKVYLDEVKIGELKKYFDNYVSDKRYHTQEKNGSVKKATEWICEVVEEGTINLHQQDAEMVKLANDKRRMFVYKNTEYFFIIPNLFRNNNDTMYYYFDEGNHKLIRLKYSVLDYPKKEQLLEAIENYKQAA